MEPRGGWSVMLALDVLSSIVLAVGIVLLLPVALHLWLGADNDSYVVIAEYAGRDPVTLAQVGLEWMFRGDYLILAALVIGAGSTVKALVWRRVRSWTVLA